MYMSSPCGGGCVVTSLIAAVSVFKIHQFLRKLPQNLNRQSELIRQDGAGVLDLQQGTHMCMYIIIHANIPKHLFIMYMYVYV